MASLTKTVVTGDNRTITVKDIVDDYREMARTSVPDGGRIQRLGPNKFSITSYFKTLDCDSAEAVRDFKVYSLETDKEVISSVRCISDLHEVVATISATSTNGRWMARLKAKKLEVWDRMKLLKTYDTTQLDKHGLICTEFPFARMQWCPFGEEDKLLYVCQPKQPKSISFFKDDNTEGERGLEFAQKQNWGECLEEVEHTVVAILDVADDLQVKVVDVEGYSLGQPSFFDNGNKIVSTAYPEEPRKLGLIYYNSRPSKIMIHDWRTGELIYDIASDLESFYDVRVNHAGDQFLFLKNPTYGVHFQAQTICLHDTKTKTNTDITSNLYMEGTGLPRNCFSSNDSHALFATHDNLNQHMCLVSLKDGSVSRIKFPTAGVNILDFHHDLILASGSEINATPTLFVAKLSVTNVKDVVAWHQIEDCIHIDEMSYTSYKIPTSDESSFASAILVKPDKIFDKSISKLPTVVCVHGGPHSAFTHFYMRFIAMLARLGLQTLLINYRGSTGVSDEYLRSLSGRVGELDVEDCLHVIRYLVKDGSLDPSKLAILGGSHGGFLACHLSCQDEFKFTSAIIRNPVTELLSCYSTSDIPDWALNVSLGHNKFYHDYCRSIEDVTKMYMCSPMSKIDKANVPTLMQLGTKDLRVPMNQGQQWVNVLRAKGVETLCRIYQDNHALAKPATELDKIVTTAVWILDHLPK